MPLLGSDLQAEGGERIFQAEMIFVMTTPALFEAFDQHEAQGFVERIVHRDRSGMMIDPFLAPVGGEQVNIEIPALDFFPALRRHFHGPRAKGNGRKTGRTTEALLRAAINRVHLPIIDSDRTTAEG